LGVPCSCWFSRKFSSNILAEVLQQHYVTDHCRHFSAKGAFYTSPGRSPGFQSPPPPRAEGPIQALCHSTGCPMFATASSSLTWGVSLTTQETTHLSGAPVSTDGRAFAKRTALRT